MQTCLACSKAQNRSTSTFTFGNRLLAHVFGCRKLQRGCVHLDCCLGNRFFAHARLHMPTHSTARSKKWNTAKVADFSDMFRGAIFFNMDLSSWDTSSATSLHSMFGYAESLNGDSNTWNTSSDFLNIFLSPLPLMEIYWHGIILRRRAAGRQRGGRRYQMLRKFLGPVRGSM